jgi:hypothetical protein
MLVGLAVILYLARRRGIDPDQMWNVAAIAVFTGIFSAKVLYVINAKRPHRCHRRCLRDGPEGLRCTAEEWRRRAPQRQRASAAGQLPNSLATLGNQPSTNG